MRRFYEKVQNRLTYYLIVTWSSIEVSKVLFNYLRIVILTAIHRNMQIYPMYTPLDQPEESVSIPALKTQEIH